MVEMLRSAELAKDRGTPGGARVYDLRRCRRARREHLTIEPFCRRCRECGLEVLAEHVDHVVSIQQGGDWFDHENLQSLCKPCHSRKSLEDAGVTLTAPRPGCRADGVPLDPNHPWNRGAR